MVFGVKPGDCVKVWFAISKIRNSRYCHFITLCTNFSDASFDLILYSYGTKEVENIFKFFKLYKYELEIFSSEFQKGLYRIQNFYRDDSLRLFCRFFNVTGLFQNLQYCFYKLDLLFVQNCFSGCWGQLFWICNGKWTKWWSIQCIK